MKYKKIILYVIIVVLLVFINCNISAEETIPIYKIGDYVYYDPVSEGSCSYKNYWTINNTDTTCFRFLVIENSDSKKETLKVMLDHNVTTGTVHQQKYGYESERIIYKKIPEVITNVENKWSRYVNQHQEEAITILKVNEMKELMQINKLSHIENGAVVDGITEIVNDESTYKVVGLEIIKDNILYIDNKQTEGYGSNGGYWIMYDDNNTEEYAHTINGSGKDRLVLKTKTRGIRPVIVLRKKLVTSDNEVQLDVKLFESFGAYEHTENESKKTYKQMQGFTKTKQGFTFSAIEIKSKENPSPTGCILHYSKNGISCIYNLDDKNHGNSMFSLDDYIYLAGDNKYENITKIKLDSNLGSYLGSNSFKTPKKFNAIAYNPVDKIFYGKLTSSALIYAYDYDYDIASDSFGELKDIILNSKIETTQSIAYRNGYLYVPTYNIGDSNASILGLCSDKYLKYQAYCYPGKHSGMIYVYNVKYNSDGSRSPNYGRLVAKFKLPSGIGEIEDISFDNENLYLGYAARKVSTDEPFKIYSVDYSKVSFRPNINVEYKDGNIKISSDEEFRINNPGDTEVYSKSISKPSNDLAGKQICDRYSNCINIDKITYSDTNAEYTGNDIKDAFKTATADSKSEIDYSYFSDSTCTTSIDKIVDAGNYYVKAMSSGNANYIQNSKCIQVTVTKANPTISLEEKTTEYTGNNISIDAASAVFNEKILELEYDYKYYTNSSCTLETEAGNGIVGQGGNPVNVGTYYVKAKSKETANFNSSSSQCTKLEITKKNSSFDVQKEIEINLLNSQEINYNFTGDGNVSCKTSASNIATCEIVNKKIKITPKAIGTAIITLSASGCVNYNLPSSYDINVIVTNDGDNVGPTISIETINDDYIKAQDINVSISDFSGLKSNQELLYAWSTSNTETPEFKNSISLINDEGELSTSIKIPGDENLTGEYYLWIRNTIKDVYGNINSLYISQQIFKFNNTPPKVSSIIVRSLTKTKGTVNISSKSKIIKKEYSSDDINYKEFSGDSFMINNIDSQIYYIRVTDELGQKTKIETQVKDELQPQINLFLLNDDNNKVNNLLLNYTEDLISNFSLDFTVPNENELVEKYTKFSINTKLNKVLGIRKEDFKIYNGLNDVTDLFNIDITDENILIEPKDLLSSEFYGKTYNIVFNSKIASGKLLEVKVDSSLETDTYVGSSFANVKIVGEIVENVPNTYKKYRILIISFVFIFAGLAIFIKKRTNKNVKI